MLILEDLTQPYLLMKTMFAPPRVPISLSCSSEDFMKMLTELFFSLSAPVFAVEEEVQYCCRE